MYFDARESDHVSPESACACGTKNVPRDPFGVFPFHCEPSSVWLGVSPVFPEWHVKGWILDKATVSQHNLVRAQMNLKIVCTAGSCSPVTSTTFSRGRNRNLVAVIGGSRLRRPRALDVIPIVT